MDAYRHIVGRPRVLRMPRFLIREELGLGELVKRVLAGFGVRPCAACGRRAQALDAMLVLSPSDHSHTVVYSSSCTTYKGKCTGFGGTQCVTAPDSLNPDALGVTQCCSGSFKYPWVELCPGQKATQGCSFCLF